MTATFADLMLDIPATNQALIDMRAAGEITAQDANAKLAASCLQNALCAYNAVAASRDDIEVVGAKNFAYIPATTMIVASLTDPGNPGKSYSVCLDLETNVAEHFYDVAVCAAALRGKSLSEIDVFGTADMPSAYMPVLID